MFVNDQTGLADRTTACRNRQAVVLRISSSLLAQIERVDQLAVGVEVRALEVVKELAAARNHAEQAAAAVMILGVDLEVIREVIDAGRKKGHLDLGRASVAFGALELGNDLRLGQFRQDIPVKEMVKLADTSVVTRAVKAGILSALRAPCKQNALFFHHDALRRKFC